MDRLAGKITIINGASRGMEQLADRTAMLLRRFDRDGDIRIPFLSAMSMLGAADNEDHSYLEIVDALRQFGSRP